MRRGIIIEPASDANYCHNVSLIPLPFRAAGTLCNLLLGSLIIGPAARPQHANFMRHIRLNAVLASMLGNNRCVCTEDDKPLPPA